jgi:diguanylate cyclase (GGDEF)-like protein
LKNMKKIMTPAVRISSGLVMFTLSAILIADLFGLVPKKNVMLLDLRQQTTEILAVQLSVAASYSRFDIVKTSLEIFVERNDDVMAASMSKLDGRSVANFGNFSKLHDSENTSEENMIVVPIFAGEHQWGFVYVEFESLYSTGILSILTDSIFGILLFITLTCFIGYMFILKKSLSVLDPKAVMPDRVCTAFNTLSEGVMILDDKEQILMANNAFAEKVQKTPEELLGINISTMKWKHIGREQRETHEDMPWKYAIRDGANRVGVALKLATSSAGVRSLSTNCAPIQDDKGKSRGVLVTFDDVTGMEETNVLLENAVTNLRKNEMEIRHKNDELEILASRDPLTGCYNRRRFFELFGKAFTEARNTNKPISLLMLDIDNFKAVNDTYGHGIGDEVICMVTDVLASHCDNENAIVSRHGGEEFCVVLPGENVDEAFKTAERLRLAIHTTSHGVYEEGSSITVSFGLACYNDKVSCHSEILENADKALYESKETGKNKTSIYEHDNNNLSSSDSKIVALKNVTLNKLDKTDAVEDSKIADPITRLPSMNIFKDRVNQAKEHSNKTKQLMAVATINLSMFHRISESMGQAAADEFLRAVGHRLKNILRRSDTVASLLLPGQTSPSVSRLRDDEFALLLTGLDDLEAIKSVVYRIQDNFKGKIEVAGSEVYVTTSVGLALYPQDGETANMLIDNASRAQKQARALPSRNSFQFYSLDANRMVVDQMQIEIDLHDAIERNQFVQYYQPKLTLASDEIVSVEALIRWEHPEKGMVPPNDFIPIAEKSDIILDIGKWSLMTACKQTKKWVDMGAKDIRTAVNISALEFSDESFKDSVVSALKDSGLDGRNLELEITESMVMDDQEAASKTIDELRFLGVTITLDDFGSGYSSLSCFGKLALDWLKLDRTFLVDAMHSGRSRKIYSSIVNMVRDTGVKVVSEGIETQEEYFYISSLNVDEIQGYIISKPVDAEAVTEILFPSALMEKRM